MKNLNSQTALEFHNRDWDDLLPGTGPLPAINQVQLSDQEVGGSILATRIRDFESWFHPLPSQHLQDQPAFTTFYEAGHYFLALYHFSSPPRNGTEALLLASAALGDQDLPSAEKALALAATLKAPMPTLLYHIALLHIAKGEYQKAQSVFRSMAYSDPLSEGPFAHWTQARQRDCQAILEQL